VTNQSKANTKLKLGCERYTALDQAIIVKQYAGLQGRDWLGRHSPCLTSWDDATLFLSG